MFLAPVAQEKAKIDGIFNSIALKARNVWPQSSLSTCTAILLGIHIPMSIMECCIIGSTDETDAERIKIFQAGLNEAGFSCELVPNSRGTQSLRLVDAHGGEKIVVHVGTAAVEVLKTTEMIQAVIEKFPTVRPAIYAIDTVMRQSKYGDDGITPGGISTEVIFLMVVAMLTKYPDVPPSEVVLLDFFITYGYHFDAQTHAISLTPPAPGETWPKKTHVEAQLCVIDPASPSRNLGAGIVKFPQLKSLFQYCWMTLSQWGRMSQDRQAQSPLSTIIGGETFWGRVLLLSLAGEEPYASVINEKKHTLRI